MDDKTIRNAYHFHKVGRMTSANDNSITFGLTHQLKVNSNFASRRSFYRNYLQQHQNKTLKRDRSLYNFGAQFSASGKRCRNISIRILGRSKTF